LRGPISLVHKYLLVASITEKLIQVYNTNEVNSIFADFRKHFALKLMTLRFVLSTRLVSFCALSKKAQTIQTFEKL